MKQTKKLVINNTLCKYPILPKIAAESNTLETIVKLTSDGKLDVKTEPNIEKNQEKPAFLNGSTLKKWDVCWIDTGVSLERVLEL